MRTKLSIGGTAGCIVAARLADADPNLSVLVIECGPNGVGNPAVDYPALFLSHLLPGAKTTLTYKSKKSENLVDREVAVQSGGVLGGGSAMNMMMYSRAQRSDFDSWQTPGWSADELLPYMKKLETYHGPGPKGRHGYDGPIHVSGGTYCAKRFQDDFIAAMNKVGYPELEDFGSLDANNGVQRAMHYISPDGKRQDTASRYLHPRLQDDQHPNLNVVVESRVVRVLVEGKRATGVVYKSRTQDTERSIKARQMVVVSCGALGTPSVLERSGIGNTDILRRAGVDRVVANVPGVGHEYHDHNLIVCPYKSSLTPEETLDGLFSGKLDPGHLIQTNDRILGWNAQDVTCKLRPNDSEVASLGPEFQEAWNKEFKDNTNRPLLMMSPLNCFPGEPTGVPAGQYFGISAFLVYPFSRGYMHITGPRLDDPLDFETGFLSDEQGLDLKSLRWTYKKQREVARRMEVFRGELASGHPPFPKASKAVCIDTDGPLADIRDIEYSAEDDAIIDQWVRENVGSTWHSLGTCRMAPMQKMGVVDENLSVYGVEGLKIADLSIVPHNIGANTNNTALVVGEKAADIFIRELGLGKE
ncbi:hypothetical protein DL771_001128 [Monosporascus sp. 5C6A]|nr:hypothetical protein DL771_001128 [Monosporascus sp. 5C6A]